ncbi:hypothetical protein Tco_0915330, partial [Tanacetum coccineum]
NQASAHDHDGHDYEDLTRMTNTQTPPPVTTVVIPTGAPLPTQWLIMQKDQKSSMVEPPAEGQSSNTQAVQAESLERKYKTEDVGYKEAKGDDVEDLVVRLRIEEDNKLAQKDTYTPDSAKANMVEHAGGLATTVTSQVTVLLIRKSPKRVNPLSGTYGGMRIADMNAMVSDVRFEQWTEAYMATLQLLISRLKGDVILKMTSEKRLQVD